MALRGMVILPSMTVHFDISREKSIKAVEQAMQENQQLLWSPSGARKPGTGEKGFIQCRYGCKHSSASAPSAKHFPGFGGGN